MRVVTHDGRAHVDDFLSVALLLNIFPQAVVYRDSTFNDEDENTIFVDFGGRYDPPRYLDHHVSEDLPASFVLVLKHYYPELYEKIRDLPEITHMSDVDTRGPHYAMKKYNYTLPPFQTRVVEAVMLELFSSEKIIEPGSCLHNLLVEIGKKFVEYIEGILNGIEIVKNSSVREIGCAKVVFLRESVDPSLVRRVNGEIDVAVMSSRRTPGGISIVRVREDAPIDFRKIADKIPAFFVHPNGFMVVVESKYVEDAIRLACKSNSFE